MFYYFDDEKGTVMMQKLLPCLQVLPLWQLLSVLCALWRLARVNTRKHRLPGLALPHCAPIYYSRPCRAEVGTRQRVDCEYMYQGRTVAAAPV